MRIASLSGWLKAQDVNETSRGTSFILWYQTAEKEDSTDEGPTAEIGTQERNNLLQNPHPHAARAESVRKNEITPEPEGGIDEVVFA